MPASAASRRAGAADWSRRLNVACTDENSGRSPSRMLIASTM
eukprot:CAMPEP_0182811722 /NCGR_PEP_ID=MMETSP0006_2-20121128/8423_1 /TAXON_ID=97485 /ORGANISM="Prymnesium parvum, Strain Texoma1" /LENGTH=41 /DNA_ID= /DNA_START= /DNA_END= /DNA_ORIENTATION=